MKLTGAAKAGDEYKVVICGSDLATGEDNSFLAIKVLGFVLEPITTEGSFPLQNSCGIAKGEKSPYVIGVAPASIPDQHITWSAVNIGSGEGYGTISWPEGNAGRKKNIKGDTCGLAKAEVTVEEDACSRGGHLNKPTIGMEVLEKVKNKVSVYVATDANSNPVYTLGQIRQLIAGVNLIYAQIAVEFTLDEQNDFHTLPPDRYWDIDTEEKWLQMQSTASNTEGVEIYFVNTLWAPDINGINWGHPGTGPDAGLTIAKRGDTVSLAHEIGHCGHLDDIYDQIGAAQLPNELVRQAWESEDWNSGPDPAYYPRTLKQPELIRRLLMYGWTIPGMNNFDIATGSVRGLNAGGTEEDRSVGRRQWNPTTRKVSHW